MTKLKNTVDLEGNNCYEMIEQGKHQEAIECLDKILESNPEDAEAWNNKGIALGKLGIIGRYQEAIECYDKAIEIYDFMASKSEISNALELDPKYVNAWLNKGFALGMLGKDQEEIEYYDKALELNLRDTEAWYMKGEALYELGMYQKALKCLDKSLEIDPKDVDAWKYKGFTLRELGRYQEAVECYDKALELDPNDIGIWKNKSHSLVELGRYQEAVECYDNELELDQSNIGKAITWLDKGNALYELEKYQESIESYDEVLKIGDFGTSKSKISNVLELDPGYTADWHVTAWDKKGFVLGKLGRYQEEVGCYGKILELDPDYIKYWNTKEYRLEIIRRCQKALECHDKAFKTEDFQTCENSTNFHGHKTEGFEASKSPILNVLKSYIWLIKAYVVGKLGKYQEVIKCYDKALELDPNDVCTLNCKGCMLGKLGRYQEALECYCKILELDPKYVDARYGKGFSLDIIRRCQKALERRDKSKAKKELSQSDDL